MTDDDTLRTYLSGMAAGVATVLRNIGFSADAASAEGRHTASLVYADPAARHEILAVVAAHTADPATPRSTWLPVTRSEQ